MSIFSLPVHPGREAVAYHEAGHAVMGIVRGVSFRYVTLRPRDPLGLGHVMYGTPGMRYADDVLLVCAAGPLAERLYRGPGYPFRSIIESGLYDLEAFEEAAELLGRDPSDALAEQSEIVMAHYPAIDTVARALLASKRALSLREVQELVLPVLGLDQARDETADGRVLIT